jgi:hypothetical protein
MIEPLASLRGDFVIVDLGSAHARHLLRHHRDLAPAITLVELDTFPGVSPDTLPLHRHVVLNQGIAGQPGPRRFKERRFAEASSFLDPVPALVRDYALEGYMATERELDCDCLTLAALLAGQNLDHVDLLKTDLEGLDFEVLASAPDIVRQTLAIQCELRFQPFFQGEPHFHQVTAFLHDAGLDLVWLRPQVWKYAVPGRDFVRDGRVVWADAIFFLRPDRVPELADARTPHAWIKQILIARILGLYNHAEHLLATCEPRLDTPVARELRRLIRPPTRADFLLANWISRLPGGWPLLGLLRRFFLRGYHATALYRDRVIGVPDSR